MAYNKLTPKQRQDIVVAVNTSGRPNYEIAAEYGISASRVGQIAREYKDQADQYIADGILRALENASGSSIGDRAWRMRQYERDLIKLDQFHTPDAVSARAKILGAVAKELGQVAPARHEVKAEVSHIIGIDMQRAVSGVTPPVIDATVVSEITDGNDTPDD